MKEKKKRAVGGGWGVEEPDACGIYVCASHLFSILCLSLSVVGGGVFGSEVHAYAYSFSNSSPCLLEIFITPFSSSILYPCMHKKLVRYDLYVT